MDTEIFQADVSDETDDSESSPEKESKNAVLTKDLSVYFNNRAGIDKISLKVKKNTVTAIIGPSGCGKSTFLRSLNLMHDLVPKARVFGEIFIHNENITDFSAVDIRKKSWNGISETESFPYNVNL